MPNWPAVSWGPFLMRASDIQNPSEVYIYKEGNAFDSALWNNLLDTNPLQHPYFMGWHGKMRTHNLSFADGHAGPGLFETQTDVIDFSDDGYVIQDGSMAQMRGGTPYSQPDFVGVPVWKGGCINYRSIAPVLLRGANWRNSAQPATPVFISGS